ncbi:MAG TPA: hypothetical protein VH165_19970 [Kofleriaceae bacterium]|jgi:hypothetical protein|nr:hypothetical protein [Kofleriaceae bacterium]
MDAFDELRRIIAPFSVEQIDAALNDQPSTFDVDARWYSSHDGPPKTTSERSPFNGDALLAGMQAVCLLGSYLPAGDPRRLGVPRLHAKILARLANPELMLFGGSRATKIEGKPYVAPGYQTNPSQHGVDNGALVVAHGYVYFRPARIAADDAANLALVRDAAELHYPMQTFPWSGLYHVWQAALSPGVAALVANAPGTPVAPGSTELDPRQSAPAIVDAVVARHKLDRDAATLYLQLLALVDCGDAPTRELNGWSQAKHKKAAATLVSAGLVIETKHPRANRKFVIDSPWEQLFPPHPACEHQKLPLYGARMERGALAAPLGRLVPLRPLSEIFAAAWQAAPA